MLTESPSLRSVGSEWLTPTVIEEDEETPAAPVVSEPPPLVVVVGLMELEE